VLPDSNHLLLRHDLPHFRHNLLLDHSRRAYPHLLFSCPQGLSLLSCRRSRASAASFWGPRSCSPPMNSLPLLRRCLIPATCLRSRPHFSTSFPILCHGGK
jgi:hypothetical protein